MIHFHFQAMVYTEPDFSIEERFNGTLDKRNSEITNFIRSKPEVQSSHKIFSPVSGYSKCEKNSKTIKFFLKKKKNKKHIEKMEIKVLTFDFTGTHTKFEVALELSDSTKS